jgi:N-dimethylarginine dimethylaminohydrolase
MCPPTYFQIAYSINPWMDVSNRVDPDRAQQQWDSFVNTLSELGDTVDFVAPAPEYPDMTFAGDAGLVYGTCFIPSNFRARERVGEVDHYVQWFKRREYEIRPMPRDVYFEGLGDVIFQEDTAIVGYGYRSDERSITVLKGLIPNLRILGDVCMRDAHYFHAAMALSFIDHETILYYPPAFDDTSVKKLERIVPYSVAVSDTDANEYFACNNVVIGRTVLLDNCSELLREALARRGYEVRLCPMSEFKKSGGSLRCLVLSFMSPRSV